MSKIFKVLIVIGLLVGNFNLLGQQYDTQFGQNRIQYRTFNWVYYSTNHFDIYYYNGGEVYAKQTLDFLETEFRRLTDLLGYAPYAKTKIFIYNSIHELQQSNIGKDGAIFSVGGQTDFVKLQIEIAHPGSAEAFKEELIYKLSRILIEDMLYGGSLAEIFQSSYLLTLPRWFIDGAARYIAYGWSSEMDDFIRDYLERNEVKKLIKVESDKAGILGQSIWNYVALKYGRSNVSNVLNLTRIIRNEENSISNTLGIGYKQFLADWQNYYIDNHENIQQHYNQPKKENEIIADKNNNLIYQNVRYNRSGTKVAYSQNNMGKFKVYVYDLEKGKAKKILTSGQIIQDQKVDYQMPLLDWVDDDQLGILYFKRGFIKLLVENVNTGQKFTKNLNRFKQVESLSFNENGRLALISGDVDGQNDIYLISMRRNATKRITNDIYDDFDPYFIPGTAAFVFSSNRVSDSIRVENPDLDEITDNFNLYVYDLDTTKNKFVKLTNTFSQDRKPVAKNQYEIFYLSDQRGISNLFKYNVLDSTFMQLTSFNKSIKDYDLIFNEDEFLFLMLDEGKQKVFLDKNVNLNNQIFTPQTARQRLKQAQFVADIYNKREIERVANKIVIENEQKQDSVTRANNPEENWESRPLDPEKDPEFVDPLDYEFTEKVNENKGKYINTENFRFEEEPKEQKFKPESFFNNFERFETKKTVYGPIVYEPQFSFKSLITSFAIDPLRGFGIVLETQINDLLENHKLTAGGMVITNFRSGDIFAEYEFLKYWMDFKFRFDRSSIFIRDDNEDLLIQKYVQNRVTVGAALPVTNWFRFELNPFYTQTNFNNLQYEYVVNTAPEDFAEDSRVNFLGATGRMVFDNTINKGFNLEQGTKFLVEGSINQALNNNERSFSSIRMDFRHYQKIHREITLATRLYYGQFFGRNKQNFLIGGVPNWLFNKTKEHVSGDPLEVRNNLDNSNLLFVEYVTNLRGFNYNERYGSSVFVMNTELRIPVFRYFTQAPLSSNFLRNFFLVGFFDFGSAWSGAIPFNRERSEEEIIYERDVFTAAVKNYSNPWLAGYGVGIRTLLLGYYVRFDYAKPIRDFEAEDGKFTVSIGLDF